jgi:hypothetical protein
MTTIFDLEVAGKGIFLFLGGQHYLPSGYFKVIITLFGKKRLTFTFKPSMHLSIGTSKIKFPMR